MVTSDEQLMLDTQRGSGRAFEVLFERYSGAVWAFFRRRVLEHHRAEELTQDVFVAMLQNAARYEARAPFRSYLFGIAWNLLCAERRRSRREVTDSPLEDAPAPRTDPDAALWVRRALSTLDPMAREVVMLREYEQLSYQEIADVLRIPVNTVRSRLFRARMDLRAALAGTDSQVQVEYGNH